MWGFERGVALRLVARGAVMGAVCAVVVTSAAAQPKPAAPPAAKTPPPQSLPQRPPAAAKKPAEPPEADVCYGVTGADAPTKVAACTEAINKGLLTGGPLALAYLHRGMSATGPDADKRSRADFRTAIRMYNDAIMAQPLNPHLYMQRGVVHQTIGEADRAIIDYSDAIRLAPRETLPLINRGVVLYLRKDNNEGAIADFNAALKINPKEISAWTNRGIVYRRKGDLNQAISDFTTAIKLLPEKIEPVSFSVVHDTITGQLERSPQQEANRLALQAAFAYLQRGLAWYDKSDYD